VLALPWNLETELTDQLRYIADWGGQLLFPLPTLHNAATLESEAAGRQTK
jgi:C-methyltransferase C-terminal domain